MCFRVKILFPFSLSIGQAIGENAQRIVRCASPTNSLALKRVGEHASQDKTKTIRFSPTPCNATEKKRLYQP
jgi:hypothetical protein